MICAPSEDLDQPWHPPCLIRVFAVRMKKAWFLSYPLSAREDDWAHSEDSDQTGRMPRLIWVFAGRACHFVGFIMRWLHYWKDVVLWFRGNFYWYSFKEVKCQNCFAPIWKKVYRKRKEFALTGNSGSIFFPFRVDFLSRRALMWREANITSQKLSPL